MDTKIELFISHLTEGIGKYPDSVFAIETESIEWDLVYVIVFTDYPEQGLFTGFTYGLSAANHTEWNDAKPELCLTVASTDVVWMEAMAYLVEWNRKTHAFLPGSLFNYGKPVSQESKMDSFLVFNQMITQENIFTTILIENEKIVIYSLYPLYQGEITLLQKVGIRKFMQLPEFKLFSINRPDLSMLYTLP